jgi:hypothetical protein
MFKLQQTHGNTLWKDRCDVAHALTKTAPATPTFAYDKRLNTEFKWLYAYAR